MNTQTTLIAIIALLVGGIGGYAVAQSSRQSLGMHTSEYSDVGISIWDVQAAMAA